MALPNLHLRDLFWLVLVCALAVGWWVDRQSLARDVAHWFAAYDAQFWETEALVRERMRTKKD